MKAVALISGGLDSTLAAHLLKEQGIELLALNFKTPFCLCDKKSSSGCASQSRQVANNLGIEFQSMNVTDDFLKMLPNPKYGYGSNMNPCIDCRILKFKKARELMQESGAAFIVTGEVLGQRPMSQHKRALAIIDKESGLEGLVLRPLSARILPESLPESQGWVDRAKLLAFSGRTRKPQIELAKKFELKDYPCPAGGCLLTDRAFSQRIRDLMRFSRLTPNDVELLKIGRHLRISPQAKLIVGRSLRENERLLNLAREGDYLFFPQEDLAGPTSLARGIIDDALLKLCSGITCYYCDLGEKNSADILYRRLPEKENHRLNISPVSQKELQAARI